MRQQRRSSSRRFSRTSEFVGVSTVCGILYDTYCIAHSIAGQEEFLLPGEKRRRNTEGCGAGGGSRTLTGFLSPADFLTAYGFRRPELVFSRNVLPVCGLDYPFTVPWMFRGLGAARLVSTPSRLDCSG